MRESIGCVSRSFVVVAALIASGCGSAGDPDDIESGLAGVPSATVTNTVADPESMQVGDVYQLLFAGGEQARIDLTGVAPDSRFILAVASLDAEAEAGALHLSSTSRNVAVAPDKSAGEAEPDDRWHWDAQDALEQQLRGWEQVAAFGRPAQSGLAASVAKQQVRAPQVGQVENFRMLSSISSLRDYVELEGELRCIGTHILWYVDTALPKRGEVTDDDVSRLCARFDAMVVDEYALFGEASDVNEDGRVAVLMSPQVNRLGRAGGGLITGFFLAGDLYPRSAGNPLSNEREMIYVLAPDSEGAHGTPISRDLALNNLIPAVLPHELQHAISYNQHVLVQGGRPEEAWLNEGLAHLAEDLLGVGFENPSRYNLYLESPSSYGLVGAGSPGLAERGGIFLFLRYLFEQHPDSKRFVWDLLHTKNTGVANVTGAFDSLDPTFDQFAEFLLRWSAVLALNDKGLTGDPRYQYRPRAWDRRAEHYSGVCTVCSADDGRGTELSGVKLAAWQSRSTVMLDPTSQQYFQLGNQQGEIDLWAPDQHTYGAILVRIK